MVRMLNGVRLPGASAIDLCPPQLAPEIDAINELVNKDVSARFAYSNVLIAINIKSYMRGEMRGEVHCTPELAAAYQKSSIVQVATLHACKGIEATI